MASTLPPQIEIFKPGRHTDDAGVVHTFSPSDVAGMASSYNPSLREAPLCIGHPKDNRPSYGLVKSLAVNADGNLAMDTHAVEPQFAEIVRTKRYSKRSASFYPPGHPSNPTPGSWYLRHVAFLGAQQPAIAGLRDIAFSQADATGTVNFSFDDAAGTVNFSEPTTKTQEQSMNEDELKAQLAAAQKLAADNATALATAQAATQKANEQLAQFAESAEKARHAGHVSFAESEVKAGHILPKDKGAAVAVLDQLAGLATVSFSEGDTTKSVNPVEWLKGYISAAKPLVNFGEFANGGAGSAGLATADMSDAELDKLAQSYAKQHKCNYAEAISAVTVSFTS